MSESNYRNQHMKWVVATALFIMVAVLGFVIINYRQQPQLTQKESTQTTTPTAVPKVVDDRAAFVIFTNGSIRVFTDLKYHNRSPDVYIEAGNPNIVRVKAGNITWQQFFDTLPAPMKIQQDCLFTGSGQSYCNNHTGTLKFYRNGMQVSGLLSSPIIAGDRVLISYGSSKEDVSAQLNRVPSP